MKALSIKQPWADWILGKNLPDGIKAKNIENRTWNTKHRGEFYIHASQKIAKDAFDWFRDEFKCEPITEGYVTGAIIGRVMLCDVVNDSKSDWAMDYHKHWKIHKPQEIEPIPAKGKLSFWDCSEYASSVYLISPSLTGGRNG